MITRYQTPTTQKRVQPHSLAQSTVNAFIFAEIGVERNGMGLSVLSALSRQDIDPWDEAKRLSSLHRRHAIIRLAKIIAAMPDSLWKGRVAIAIATRLVALLPAHGGDRSGSPELSPDGGVEIATGQRRKIVEWAYLSTPLIALALGLMLNLLAHRAVSLPHDAARNSAPPSLSAPAHPAAPMRPWR